MYDGTQYHLMGNTDIVKQTLDTTDNHLARILFASGTTDYTQTSTSRFTINF